MIKFECKIMGGRKTFLSPLVGLFFVAIVLPGCWGDSSVVYGDSSGWMKEDVLVEREVGGEIVDIFRREFVSMPKDDMYFHCLKYIDGEHVEFSSELSGVTLLRAYNAVESFDKTGYLEAPGVYKLRLVDGEVVFKSNETFIEFKFYVRPIRNGHAR